MSHPTTVALAQDISRLRDQRLELSRYKYLTLRYVESCHSIQNRNQIHLEFKSENPIILNNKYVKKIEDYCKTLNLNVYDILSNGRDRVYVFATPSKPRSPVGVVRPQVKSSKPSEETVPVHSTQSTSSSLTKQNDPVPSTSGASSEQLVDKRGSLQNNPAVKETIFNGARIMTPIVFVKAEVQPGTIGEEQGHQVPLDDVSPSTPNEDPDPTTRDTGRGTAKMVVIPTNYNSLQYNMCRLTNNENFTRLRKFLACYTGKATPTDIGLLHETDSYVSLKTQLMNEGFPQDNDEMRKLYFEFLVGRGFSTYHIEKDLEKLKVYYDNSHMVRSNLIKTNFRTYYYGNSSGRERYITEQGSSHSSPGRSAPDLCVVV